MARPFHLTDIGMWPPHEQRVFVLEHLIQAHEDDLAKVETLSRTNPDSTPHTARAADLRVLIRVLHEILNAERASSK